MIDKIRLVDLHDIVETLINFNILTLNELGSSSKKNKSIRLNVEIEEITEAFQTLDANI